MIDYLTIKYNKGAKYKLIVKGKIEKDLAEMFGNMELDIFYENQDYTITSIKLMVSDQAAIIGLINALYDMHLIILLVECLGDKA